MGVPMGTIVSAIAQDIDVRPDLIKRAIEEGFAERVDYVVLTAKGRNLLKSAAWWSRTREQSHDPD